MERFRVVADINTSDPKQVESVLIELVGVNGVIRTEKGFKIATTIEGQTASELNRELLSALRQVDEKTTLRAEWIRGKLTERFFDYVPKGIRET